MIFKCNIERGDVHCITSSENLIINIHVQLIIQWNLSILDTLGPQKTVLIIEVSLFHRVIYTHLYCNGTTTECPDYRGVLISECPQ